MPNQHTPRLTPNERSIPPAGKMSREQAWAIVVEHHRLVKHLTWKYAQQLTGYGETSFYGLDAASLFEELIGAAQEAALKAVENHEGKGKLDTYIGRAVSNELFDAASEWALSRGDALSIEPDEALYLADHVDEQDQEDDEIPVKEYVDRLVTNLDITDEQRRWVYEIMRPTGVVIPYFSPAWRDLKAKIVKRAMYLQAEGFGYPHGWERAIQRRILQHAHEMTDGNTPVAGGSEAAR